MKEFLSYNTFTLCEGLGLLEDSLFCIFNMFPLCVTNNVSSVLQIMFPLHYK